MKNSNPPHPVITFDHLGKENAAKDPAYQMTRRILYTAECLLVLTLLAAMLYLY